MDWTRVASQIGLARRGLDWTPRSYEVEADTISYTAGNIAVSACGKGEEWQLALGTPRSHEVEAYTILAFGKVKSGNSHWARPQL